MAAESADATYAILHPDAADGGVLPEAAEAADAPDDSDDSDGGRGDSDDDQDGCRDDSEWVEEAAAGAHGSTGKRAG